jgi:hypothetical protein
MGGGRLRRFLTTRLSTYVPTSRTDGEKSRGEWKRKEVDGEKEEKGGPKEGGNEDLVEELLWDLFFFFLFLFFNVVIVCKYPLPILPFLFLSFFFLSLTGCILSPLAFYCIFFFFVPHRHLSFSFSFSFLSLLFPLPHLLKQFYDYGDYFIEIFLLDRAE